MLHIGASVVCLLCRLGHILYNQNPNFISCFLFDQSEGEYCSVRILYKKCLLQFCKITMADLENQVSAHSSPSFPHATYPYSDLPTPGLYRRPLAHGSGHLLLGVVAQLHKKIMFCNCHKARCASGMQVAQQSHKMGLSQLLMLYQRTSSQSPQIYCT